MSIKNPDIIHYIIKAEPYYDGDDGLRYLCNHACGSTKEKSTLEKEKVTCRNCKYRLVEKMSWKEFDKACIELARKIKKSKKKYEGIYPIPRGGLCVGVRLSHLLDIPVFNYVIMGQNVLIVDDISDTGKTLKQYQKYDIATLYYHKQSKVVPTYWIKEKKDKWIVYPWENI